MEKADTRRQMDMLHGSIFDKILLFALPLAASSMLQQLFNSADIAVVGRFADSTAQAAVGCNSSLINLMINLFVGLTTGANVVIANYIGQGREKDARQTAHTSMFLALVSGFFLLALGQVVASPVLHLMNTPAETVGQAIAYFRIYFLGMPFIMVYNFGAAVLRSVGDTRRPLLCLAFSGVLNVALNLLTVIVFRLGAMGVAIATSVSNGVSASLVVFFLMRTEDTVRLDLRKLRIASGPLKRIMQVGIPAGLQGMAFSLSNVCIQTAINDFGTVAAAGFSVSTQIDSYIFFITSAFSQATVTFTSQNYGAHQLDRCRRVYRMSLFTAVGVNALLCGTLFLLRMPLVQIFTKDAAAIPFALTRMQIGTLFAFVAGTYEISGAAMRGIGRSMTPAIIAIVGTCVFRVAWIYLLFPLFPQMKTFTGLMLVYPITWSLTGVVMIPTYLLARRRIFARAEAALEAESALSAAL